MKKQDSINVRDERIVVDSEDVQRATDLAAKRKRAAVSDIVVDGKVVNEEIFQDILR